jgi:hypothetical protein
VEHSSAWEADSRYLPTKFPVLCEAEVFINLSAEITTALCFENNETG